MAVLEEHLFSLIINQVTRADKQLFELLAPFEKDCKTEQNG